MHAQTIVPAGLGQMSATQPNRETAILTGILLRTGGQNPTVKIVWGDEDGEIPDKSWDNTVVISTNQAAVSFSTTITIPNQEKIYYFRSVAENAGGTVVSRSLGVLNPSAPVGVADLRGRWSFDDDNFSSAVSPADYSNLKLWLDAADTSTITHSSNAVSEWNDKSGNEFNLSQSTSDSQPTYDTTNRKVTFSSDFLSGTAPTLSQPLTFFTVLEYSGSNTNGQYVHDSSAGRYVFGEWSSDGWGLIRGDSSLYSTTLNPTTKSVFSYQFNGSSSAVFINGNQELSGTHPTDNLGGNYVLGAHNGGSQAPFQGSIYEHLIISNISSQDRQKIEAYLAQKWGITLTNSVNSIHAAKDSSGNNHHGILKKTFNPTNLSSTPKLWLDASELTSAGATWTDKSGNDNHGTKTGSPAIISNFQNGNTVMHYNGDAQYHDFDFITDIRTVFWVVSQDASANGSGYRFLLCDSTKHPHWHNSNDGKFWGNANSIIKNGLTRMNGVSLTEDTNYPNNLSIISHRTTADADADRFGFDRSYSGRQWIGKLGELIIYNTALSDSEIIQVEGYLAHKWGLAADLVSSHPYKSASPLASGIPSFIADTPFGDGKAIDLADGHVEISTGGNEDVFDGNGSFSVSAWIKGWPSSKNAPIVSKESLPDTGWKASRLYGDADSEISSNYTYTTSVNLEGSTRTINGVTFSGTTQRSGGGWSLGGFTNAIPANHSGLNSSVTGNIGALLHNDGFKFSGTQRLTISGLSSGNTYVLAMYSQAWGGDRTNTVTCSDLNETLTINECLYHGQTPDGLLIECTYIANGTTADFTFSGNSWHLHAFSNREATNGWSITRGNLETNDLSVNIGGIGGSKTATHSTTLSTDNLWHHIVSTYDGGTRKIYLDGTEVSSATASGAVASTAASLLLGASDMNNTAGTIAAARHSGVKLDEVRFYSSGLTSSQVSALYNFGKGDIGNIGEFSNLPAKISGTTGTALSTTVTAGFPNAYYEAVNLTPGLGINSATGEISGTPTVGGVGSINVIARNAAGKRAVTTIPYDSSPSGPAFSFPTLSPGSDHAVILGEISHSGGEENTVDLFWGDNDGNQTLSNWDSNATPLGTGKEGFYGTTISGLTAGETYYYRIRSQGKINPKGISGSNLQLWFDASDSSTISHSSNAVSTWKDKSGNGYHATTPTGSPTLNPTGGPVGKPVVEFRSGTSNGTTGDEELSISGTFTVKDHFYVVRSPSATWSDFGGIIGGGGSRDSNFIFERSENYFHNNVYPSAVWKNGSSITSSNFNLSVINQYMILRIVVNDNNLGPHSNWKLGDDGTGWSMDMDLAEAVCFSSQLSPSDAQKVEGYLAHKWGLEGNLPSSHSYLTNHPVSQTSWSTVQSFTTPTNVTVPVLGSLSTANLNATTADLESTLTDNGNAATNLVFYWGDNDGGTNPTNWDSNFTVSNAQEGTLRKSLTGLTGGTTYYFRTYASNWKGNAWASTTRSFTTVTSTVRDNPVRNSDLKGWWKLDGDLKDSSGNNHHGDGDFLWKPSVLSTLKVWFDASDSSTISHSSNAVSHWNDKSGNDNHATQTTSSKQPILTPNGLNGKPYVTFDGSNDSLVATSLNITQSYSFFIAAKRDSGSSTKQYLFDGLSSDSYRSLLSLNKNGMVQMWAGSWTTSNINTPSGAFIVSAIFNSSSSRLSLNGTGVTNLDTNTRNLTNGIRIGGNYADSADYLKGSIAEFLILDETTTSETQSKIEGYLAHKWGLKSNLPADHRFKSSQPITSNPFSSNVASGTGQSLDLSNGVFATVSTGGTEDVFDGDSNFSVSMWVKGWPSEANQTLISKSLIPTLKGISPKMWLDAADANTIHHSSNSVTQWDDKSGNDNHATQTTSSKQPILTPNGLNGKPYVTFDGSNDSLVATSLNITQSYSFFIAAKRDSGSSTKQYLFDGLSSDSYRSLLSLNKNGMVQMWAGSWTTSNINTPSGAFIVSAIFNSSSSRLSLNGTGVTNLDTNTRNLTNGIRIGGNYPDSNDYLKGSIAEFLILDETATSETQSKIEGYLAHKWGLTSQLPAGHPGTSGWSLERSTSGPDDLTLNLVGAGGKFTQAVPMNDDSWHHLVTTFGSGTKKIFVDGQEVGSTSQSGSVTDSISKLFLGDPYASGSNQPKIDDARFYRGILSAADISAIYNNRAGDVGAPKFAISSPATIQGAKGKSISYEIVADEAYGLTGYNSSITYSLLNAPNWLSVGSSSGSVTGTPPAAGTYTFDVKAVNTLGSNVKTVTLTVYDYSDWQYALPITTDLSNGTTLTDWNMLVRLSETDSNGTGNRGFRYSQARSNGGDLRFIDNSGTELKYEIAKWNPSEESHVWVNIPILKSDANITMHWGNSSAGRPTYASDGSVWKDYFGVYHLEGSSGNAEDSSPMSNDLPGVNTPVLENLGLAGAAYSTTTSAANGFLSNSLNGTIQAKEGTYSIWAKTPSSATSWKDWFGLEYNNNTTNSLRLEPDTSSPANAHAFSYPSTEFSNAGYSLGLNTPNDNAVTGNWQMLTLLVKDGYASLFVDGTLDGAATWYHPGLVSVTGLAMGRGTSDVGPNTTIDEATFSTVGRSAAWLSASFHNQKPSSTYLNFGSLIGPISLDDPSGTKIFGKKDSNITSFTVGHSGSGSFSATGLPPGLSINSATGIIEGSTSVVGSQNFTVTATGTTAGGANVSVTKQYRITITDPASFPFRMNLTLSGYTGSSTLKDFPVLISLSSSITGFSYNGLLDPDSDGIRTGGDLRFFDSNGKELAYEIADWNTSGTSNIWIKVPSISGNNTVITAAWGKSGTETTPDYATEDPVWSNGYEGAWHFSTNSNSFPDSTPNAHHATRNSVGISNAGQVGQAASFTGSEFADVAYSSFLNMDKFTVSIWAKRGSGTGYAAPYSARGNNDGTRGYILYSQGATPTFQFWTGKAIAGSWHSSPVSSAHSLNTWYHVVSTYDGITKKIWLNGVGGATNNSNPNYANNTLYGLRIGAGANENATGQYFWNGALDELRYSSINRSADWIKAEYDNQKSSQSLVSYGSITGPRIITSPLTATGTFNSAFSYTLSASDSSNISSRVFYGLPEGLDFNDNGQITGTPTVAGNYQVALVVNYNNDDGSATDSDSLNDKLGSSDPMDSNAILLNLSIGSLPPTIDTLPATSVSATRANFEGNVTSTGGIPPQINIYYGTSDGTTNPSSWTSVLNIGNKATGGFSNLIGDLQPSTTYHYRVRAFNEGAPGGVWAPTSKSFTTGITNKPVAANGALTNATGSTATLSGKITSIGTGSILPEILKPNEISGLELWLDASELTSAGSSWADKSGKENNAAKTGSPSVSTNAQNGLSVMNFTGNGQRYKFNMLSNIRTVFWVICQDSSVFGSNQFRYLLNDSTKHPHWHNSSNDKFWSSNTWTSTYIKSGVTRLNGTVINGVTTSVPSSLSIVSLRTTDSVDADNFGYDRHITSRQWIGKLGELIIVNTPLTDNEIIGVEGYLARKWGLTTSLPSNHPTQPINGAKLTLYWGSSDGGENENSWDNAVSLGKKSSPLAVWFDASDLDGDGTVDTNASGDITVWKDKSGNNRHASGGGNAPFLNSAGGPNGKQVIEQRSGEYLNVSGSFFAKDHFYVWRSPPANTTWTGYGGALGHNPASGYTQRDSNYITQHGQTYFHSSQLPAGVSKNGLPLSGSFDLAPINQYHVVRIKVNNNNVGPYSRYQIGRLTGLQCNLDIAEIIAFESELSDDEADKIESYLAHKWGLADQLTPGHAYKDRVAIRSPRDLGVSTELTGLVKGNSYYYRVKAENTEGTDWADSTASFVSESRIDMSSGDITFYTDPPIAWTASDGSGGNGLLETLSWTDAQSNTVQHKVAKYSFNQINIGDGVRVSLLGTNPIHLDVENNATILAELDASGSTTPGKSVLGGGRGGQLEGSNTVTRQSDLVAWWKFDETTGISAQDSSGNSRDATLQNMSFTTNSVAGKIGGALKFDSGNKNSSDTSGQWVDGGSWAIGGAMSLSTWIKLDVYHNWQRIIDFGYVNGGGSNIIVAVPGSGNDLGFHTKATAGGDESHQFGNFFSLNDWIHVTVTLNDAGTNASTKKAYKNGTLFGTSAADKTGLTNLNRTSQRIGRSNWAGDRYLKGSLDDLRIYNVELSSSEVSSIYNNGTGEINARHGTGPVHVVGANPYNSGGSRQKAGNLSGSGLVAGDAPGGGSYGGKGGRPELNGGTDDWGTHPISGQTYGNINLEALLAGSGGGAGSVEAGSGGGGAIKITAGGKLIVGKNIYANAGMGNSDSTNDAAKSGAGGSGGAVYLKASDLVINSGVSIRADGGPGAPLATDGNSGATDGGGTGSAAGGGGRVYLEGTNSFINHDSLTNENISASKGGESSTLPLPFWYWWA
jgi:hypothetical protein